ncbi:1299_t:CDS:2 [Dentiscutata erythropus]|uniref:1299_t:CDS:1 n=1 Tax=Dentiscutata erythropus TaxID=1348616 RepID=A0A9N9HBZ8_9GLOM|nr:1299_t:CDS:2 [Dentiscutata erythropus]
MNSYINTGTFSDKNEVGLLDIFIAADEMELLEIKQQVENCLLGFKTAWRFPKDFITIFRPSTLLIGQRPNSILCAPD